MNTRRLTKLFALLLALLLGAAALAACSSAEKQNEANYLLAYEKLEQKDYQAAFDLFLALGDYKDAAKEVARFHYVPVNYAIDFVDEEDYFTGSVTISFDENHLPTQRLVTHDDGYTQSSQFTFDENGWLIRRMSTYDDGLTDGYEYTYNADGKVKKEIVYNDDGTQGSFDYFYNDEGVLEKIIANDLPHYYLSYTYTYDAQGREILCAMEDVDATYFDETTYNEAGDILSVVRKDESGNELSNDTHEYDEKGRKIKTTYTENGSVWGTVEYTYNENDQLLREFCDYEDYYDAEEDVTYVYTYEYTYEYDENGNLSKITVVYDGEDTDILVPSYEFVYVPFDYSEKEWQYFTNELMSW